MATQNKTGTTVTSGVPVIGDTGAWDNGSSVYVAKATIDLTGEAPGDTDGEIYQCLPIPADTLVANVWLKIVTPAVGTSLAIDVGVGGDNSWDDAVDAKAAAGTVTFGVMGTDANVTKDSATGYGTFLTTADTIDVTFEASTGITAGPKFEIYAQCININTPGNDT